MKFRDILAIAASGSPHDSVAAATAQLAGQNNGRITGLVAAWMPALVMTEGWVASPVWENVRVEARAQLGKSVEAFRRRLDVETAAVAAVSGILLEDGEAADEAAMRARHHDLAIVGCPQTDGERRLVESVLFNSGRPVLLAPRQWTPRRIGSNIVVAWTPTREASRALHEASDLIADAVRVTALTVDMTSACDECRNAGSGVVAHLARRGLDAKSCAIAPIGRTEGKAVLDHAHAIDADLVVMGGYGHSRMSEFIFGGMTREILGAATMPVLLAH